MFIKCFSFVIPFFANVSEGVKCTQSCPQHNLKKINIFLCSGKRHWRRVWKTRANRIWSGQYTNKQWSRESCLRKNCSAKFTEKAPTTEFYFQWSCWLEPVTLLKTELYCRCFPVKFTKCFRIDILDDSFCILLFTNRATCSRTVIIMTRWNLFFYEIYASETLWENLWNLNDLINW